MIRQSRPTLRLDISWYPAVLHKSPIKKAHFPHRRFGNFGVRALICNFDTINRPSPPLRRYFAEIVDSRFFAVNPGASDLKLG